MKYRAVKCQTADEACRLLQDLATSQVERQAVPRTLRAVAQWIVDDQTAQQETRAGMGRMITDFFCDAAELGALKWGVRHVLICHHHLA